MFNWSILISSSALLVSVFVFWKQHLRPTRIWCRFKSIVFYNMDPKTPQFEIILPISIANEGAKTGVISNWAVYLRKKDNSKEAFVFHGAGMVDVPGLLDALRKKDASSAKMIKGGNPVLRLGGGEQRDIGIMFIAPETGGYTKAKSQEFLPSEQLSIGKYDLELWCFVKKWARYHKVSVELNQSKLDALKQNLYFINNCVPEFDLLRPDLDPDPRGKS